MCGIIGIASSRRVDERSWLAIGRDAMRHRGPDDAGEWWSPEGNVGLAHRRLAIIDISSAGHQPMLDPAGELAIVFNGEIYNFQDLRTRLEAKGRAFQSKSDTETILAAYQEWGTDCVLELNGMFTFALYDSRARVLFLARDRAGEKPLFYSAANGLLRFASELKGLLADASFPREADRVSLDCYLAQGFVPGDRSILSGIRKLPPAHVLTFDVDSGQSRVSRYWQLPEEDPLRLQDVDENDLLDELESLLETAVRRQLVADVPLGILLSGGVDSSLVTALAVRAAPNVKTFTVRFPGYARYDETAHARLIAQHFATDHQELDADAVSLDTLPILARQFDEPLIDSSMIPTFLVSKLVRSQCTVALGGDGGDELFGGYSHYDRLLRLQQRFGWIPRFARAPIAFFATTCLPVGFKGRNWLQGLATDLDNEVPMIASYFDSRTRRGLLSGHRQWPLVAESARRDQLRGRGDLLQRASRLDFETYLPEDILVKVDRASMLNSLEVRAPMLDFRVIEFAFGEVPSRLKVTPNSRKVLLKKLVGRLLPPAFDRARKQGFAIPLSVWLRSGPWADYFRDVLLDESQTTFDHRIIRSLLAGQRNGMANDERLFGLLMFELWRREYRVEIGSDG